MVQLTVARMLSCMMMVVMFTVVVEANDVNRQRIFKSMMKSTRSVEDVPPSYFSQTLDHFAVEPVTFQQKYYVNNQFWTNTSGPVFLNIEGEGPASSRSVTSGEFASLAQSHGALMLALEHRFYGESQPFSFWNSTSLTYLTTSQALEDVANFQQAMIKAYNLTSANQWIVFGCSYSGALSAWYRVKYPHLTLLAMSTSSPVEATLDFYQYDQFCGQALGPRCMSLIQSATASIEQALSNPNATIKELFNCQGVEDPVAFLYVLADVIAFTVQYDSNYHLLAPVCEAFENTTDVVYTYSQVVKQMFNLTGNQCEAWDITSFTNQTANDEDNMRQWMWQSCLELGYFQTAPANNSLRSTQITAEWHLTHVCAKLFDINTTFNPKIDWTNHVYGGQSLDAENVIFTNGLIDPWRFLSVTSSSSPSIFSILVANGSHCPNWGTPNNMTDPAPVNIAHQLIASYFNGYLVTGCPEDCNGNGGCLPVQTGETDVTMVCQCSPNWYGETCNTFFPNPSSSSDDDDHKHKKKGVPWWSLIIVAAGVLILAVPIGYFVGKRVSRSQQYSSV